MPTQRAFRPRSRGKPRRCPCVRPCRERFACGQMPPARISPAHHLLHDFRLELAPAQVAVEHSGQFAPLLRAKQHHAHLEGNGCQDAQAHFPASGGDVGEVCLLHLLRFDAAAGWGAAARTRSRAPVPASAYAGSSTADGHGCAFRRVAGTGRAVLAVMEEPPRFSTKASVSSLASSTRFQVTPCRFRPPVG